MTVTTEPKPLTDVLSFVEEDLQANEGGELSAGQAAHWQRQAVISGVVGFFSTLIYTGLFYFITFSLEASVAILGVSLALIFAPEAWRAYRMIRDVRAGVVEQIEGVVSHTSTLSLVRRYSRQFYVVCTAADGTKKRFPVQRDAYLAFLAEETYQIFYLPLSQQMIAARTRS
jgi:hypothetical protein